MTSKEEQTYVEHYARSIYRGAGEIVDRCCWLGSTTIPLARGLSNNPSRKALKGKIHAFDHFNWEDWMDEDVIGTELEGKFKPGDRFLGEFKTRAKPWSSRILICEGDIGQVGWIGKGIEFLLIDAMKSWELANTIIKEFFPSLIVNKGLILQQDFAH